MTVQTEAIIEFNIDDLNRDWVRQQFTWLTHDPERMGDGYRADYVDHLNRLRDTLAPLAEGREEELKADLERYRQGYLKRYTAFLAACGRTASAFIAGPAKFPVAQQEKRHATRDKRMIELDDWQKKTQNILRRKYNPPAEIVISGLDPDAIEKLTAKLDSERTAHVAMVEANKAARAAKETQPYKAFELRNSSARIKQIEDRITQLKVRKQVSESFEGREGEINGLTWKLTIADERLCIVFSGKPDEALRSSLKRAAFKWSPTRGAWVRQYTGNAVYSARQLLKF